MTTQSRITAARQELMAVADELRKQLAQDRGRTRGPLMRQLHEIRVMLNPAYAYSSQAGQDMVIDRLFKGKSGGTFVDIGGYDGTSGSNTLFFEKWRDWRGVLVEPVSQQLEKARAVRSCPCLGYAIAETAGTATFIAVTGGFTQMSGLAASYDPTMLKRIRADPRHAEVECTVPTRTLQGVLVESDILNPDFISLDIEGGEIDVLRSFPFSEHQVGAWAIENNTGTGEIAQIMRENGYDLFEFCGPDEIYVRRNS